MTTTTDLIARLDALLADDPDSDRYFDARMLLIDDADADTRESDATDEIRDIIRAIRANAELPYHDADRDALSRLLLDFSLCPLHEIDYAICFDDDEDACRTIRALFPSHDT